MSVVAIHAVSSVLRKTNRILSGLSDLGFVIDEFDVQAPGFTDGKTIHLNMKDDWMKGAFASLDADRMITINGVNYHELAHILFTPRLDDPLVSYARDKGYFLELNILEDQSAETRFSKLYSPATRYFVATAGTYFMSGHIESGYPLVSGRLFLPDEIRGVLRDAYFHQSKIDDIDRIVEEYKTLHVDVDRDRMKVLLKEFHDLFKEDPPQYNQYVGDHSETKHGRPMSPDDVKEIDQRSDPSESGQGNSGGGGEDEDDSDPQEGDGGQEKTLNRKEIRDLIQEALDEVKEELAPDVERLLEAVEKSKGSYNPRRNERNRKSQNVTLEMVNISKRCIDELSKLENTHAPGWHHGQRTGKLNHRSYARALSGDEHVYRRWREGRHKLLEFEVVFLQDCSGSMQASAQEAAKANWILRSMFDRFHGSTTTLAFGSYTELLFSRGERANRTLYQVPLSSGSTYVSEALEEAELILRNSTKRVKLCVVVTDGGFSDWKLAIDRLDGFPEPVILVGLNLVIDPSISGAKSVLVSQTISDPIDLVEIVKKTATELAVRMR